MNFKIVPSYFIVQRKLREIRKGQALQNEGNEKNEGMTSRLSIHSFTFFILLLKKTTA